MFRSWYYFINSFLQVLGTLMKRFLHFINYFVVIILICLHPIITNSQAQSEVKIGTQVWTSKNLDVSTFRNGDSIPEVKSKEEWVTARSNKQPAWSYYDNDEKNGKKYGKLYNWYAVNDSRGLAPKGYHIPSDAEWTLLTDFLGGDGIAGDKMKSKSGWKKYGKKSGNGTNSSGFNALPGGYRYNYGQFLVIGKLGSWSSSAEVDANDAGSRYLGYDVGYLCRGYSGEEEGLSVRCIKD